MIINAIKTKKVLPNGGELFAFLDEYVTDLEEYSILAISSKIISMMEGRIFVRADQLDDMIKREADYFAKSKNKYNRNLTIKHSAFISAAGIDLSNGDGKYVLLPVNPQETAKQIYSHLVKKFNVQKFGVIICDSRSMPLRRGAMGVAIGFWGFSPLRNYIGEKDVFGRKLEFEQANLVDALAATAVLAMGEGGEQTPLALMEGVANLNYNSSSPTDDELEELYVTMENDFFHQFYDNIFSA